MRSLELERLWSWLPTFRVVAEYESITEAARVLRLSASAISRSVRLLENELGQPLFVRANGGLALNHVGREFLEAVRRSMRIVDDGAGVVRGSDTAFRIAVPRGLLAQVAPAIERFCLSQHGSPLFVRDGATAKDVAAGITDVLIAVGATHTESVEAQRLGSIELGAFVAPGHRSIDAGASGASALTECGWITAPNDFPDLAGWPIDVQRRVCIEVSDCLAAREACAAGLGPALLPQFLATQLVTAGQLVKIARLDFPALPVHALRRPRLLYDRAQALIDCLRTVFRPEQAKLLEAGPVL